MITTTYTTYHEPRQITLSYHLSKRLVGWQCWLAKRVLRDNMYHTPLYTSHYSIMIIRPHKRPVGWHSWLTPRPKSSDRLCKRSAERDSISRESILARLGSGDTTQREIFQTCYMCQYRQLINLHSVHKWHDACLVTEMTIQHIYTMTISLTRCCSWSSPGLLPQDPNTETTQMRL